MAGTEFAILCVKSCKDIHRREGRDQKSLRQPHVVIASGVCACVRWLEDGGWNFGGSRDDSHSVFLALWP